MLVDKEQAIKLALAELGDKLRIDRFWLAGGRKAPAIFMAVGSISHIQHEWRFIAKDGIKQSSGEQSAWSKLTIKGLTNPPQTLLRIKAGIG